MDWYLNCVINVCVIILQVQAERTGRHRLRQRVESSTRLVEDDEPKSPMWPPWRPRLESEEEDAEPPQRPQKRKKPRRRANPYIESETGVEGDASDDESDGNNDLADFIVPNYVKYLSFAYVFNLIHAIYVYDPHVFIICTCTIRLGVVFKSSYLS